MPDNLPKKNDATIGYFTVVDDPRTGWTGGLLVLDRAGRPLEFQCTLPVRPTRAHEILFGPTLRSHLVAQVIGKLLISKCRTPLSLICCDLPEGLKLESFTKSPVALVLEATTVDGQPVAATDFVGSEPVKLAGSTFLVPMDRHAELDASADFYNDLPDAVEPFERIREAVKEAHSQLSRQGSEAA